MQEIPTGFGSLSSEAAPEGSILVTCDAHGFRLVSELFELSRG